MPILSALHHWWLKQRLISKHAIIVLGAIVTFVPAALLVGGSSSWDQFLEIEKKMVAQQAARARNAISVYERTLSNAIGDYSNWDDSQAYLAAPTEAFEKSTLNPFTFKTMGVDVITYVRFTGEAVFARASDHEKVAYIDDESAFFKELTSAGAFFDAARSKPNHQAYVRTKRGLYMLYSQWVKNSQGEGKPIGFMVMGNLLDGKQFSEALQADASLTLDVPKAIASKLSASANPTYFETKKATITSTIGIFGQSKELLATINYDTPRQLIQAGIEGGKRLILGLAIGLAIMVFGLVWGIRNISVRRLQRLEAFVRDYRSKPDMAESVIAGRDEIASLGRQFQEMADELDNAERELTQRSYLQGKADSAAGMLHNVRNALAPIRVMQEKWLREESLPFRQNMIRAADELARDDLDEVRRVELERFMITAARQIALAGSGRMAEMEETKASIDQVSAILAGYNFNTSGETGGDEIDFLKLLGQEVKVLNGREGADVQFELPTAVPHLLGNPLHLTQVIGNILVNADEAMIAAGVPEKRIVIRVSYPDESGVEIRFRDNGDGIAAENINDTFKREYSTRSHKAGGIGLHWCSNVMRAMGGSIRLDSEGVGMGATAILTLRKAEATEARQAA